MGGAGSGGYKNSPGDVETHSAWDLIDPLPGGFQKLRQAKCKYCSKEMAQHTSRQRTHLLTCQAYLDAMKMQGIENSITQRAANPSAHVKPAKADHPDGIEKRKLYQRIADFPTAVRIQALALAEASISYERIREITGVETKLLDRMRKTARERGYDPTSSMQIKDEYVADLVKPKKQRLDGSLQNGIAQAPAERAIPDYVQADTSNLPPGNWNFMAAAQVHSASSLG